MRIGDYTITMPIGTSRSAQTFRVEDAGGHKCFLKLYNLAKLSQERYIGDITNITEFDIVSGLHHVNLAEFVSRGDIVLDGQRHSYMTTDYISGESIAARLERERRLPVYEVRQIAVGVLNALKYLHRQETPIIHNAICPEHIMLDMATTPNIVRLVGFGRAQRLETDMRDCNIDGLNPFYLAPETFHGLCSTRTDLYAVGTLMYHLLFGIEPWPIDLSKTTKDNRPKAWLDERKQPLKIPNIPIFELDDNLLNIIAKAVSQDVDRRFQSADEFLRALNDEIAVEDGKIEKIDVAGRKEKISAQPVKTKKRGHGFADVAGMEELKQRLQTEVIDLIRNPEPYRKLRVKIPNGMLLYGPPGCGKTFIAEKFAEELGCNYLYVHCSDVASPYIHGGQEKIAEVFKQAHEKAPTVLLLDELDAMVANRSLHNNSSEYGEVNEFLTQLNNCAENQVFVVGTTNNPKRIDPAALRSGRLDIKMFVPLPDDDNRRLLLELYLKDRTDKNIDLVELVEQTNGYSAKDIDTLTNRAALAAVRANKPLITMKELLQAISDAKRRHELPSVSPDIIMLQEQMRQEFEGHNNNRNRVGFI